jgi:hypothetical protein
MQNGGRVILTFFVFINCFDSTAITHASILWENCLVCKVLRAQYVILDYCHDVSALVDDSMLP